MNTDKNKETGQPLVAEIETEKEMLTLSCRHNQL